MNSELREHQRLESRKVAHTYIAKALEKSNRLNLSLLVMNCGFEDSEEFYNQMKMWKIALETNVDKLNGTEVTEVTFLDPAAAISKLNQVRPLGEQRTELPPKIESSEDPEVLLEIAITTAYENFKNILEESEAKKNDLLEISENELCEQLEVEDYELKAILEMIGKKNFTKQSKTKKLIFPVGATIERIKGLLETKEIAKTTIQLFDKFKKKGKKPAETNK